MVKLPNSVRQRKFSRDVVDFLFFFHAWDDVEHKRVLVAAERRKLFVVISVLMEPDLGMLSHHLKIVHERVTIKILKH